MKELSDAEFDMLHTIIHDECIYPASGSYDEEETKLIDSLFSKVMEEAKRRGRWWAR